VATETNIALLGYGTVGAAVDRLLAASADDIERATGHRLRLVKALVRDLGRYPDAPAGLLTTDFDDIARDPSIAVAAEVMGGLDPAGPYVLDLLARGKHVVTVI
jgi:homoserine dehydrogenase